MNATTVAKIVKELEEVTKNETNIKTYLDVAFAVDVIVNVADSQSNNTEVCFCKMSSPTKHLSIETPLKFILRSFSMLILLFFESRDWVAGPSREFRGPRAKEKDEAPANEASRKFSGSRS